MGTTTTTHDEAKLEIQTISKADFVDPTVQGQVNKEANFVNTIQKTNQNNGARRRSLEVQTMVRQNQFFDRIRRDSQVKKTKELPPLISERKNNLPDRRMHKPQHNCEENEEKNKNVDQVKESGEDEMKQNLKHHFSEAILEDVDENEVSRENCQPKRSKKFRPQRIL